MHISNANILEMVKDKVNITIAIEYEERHGLSIGIFALDHDTFYRSRSSTFQR